MLWNSFCLAPSIRAHHMCPCDVWKLVFGTRILKNCRGLVALWMCPVVQAVSLVWSSVRGALCPPLPHHGTAVQLHLGHRDTRSQLAVARHLSLYHELIWDTRSSGRSWRPCFFRQGRGVVWSVSALKSQQQGGRGWLSPKALTQHHSHFLQAWTKQYKEKCKSTTFCIL